MLQHVKPCNCKQAYLSMSFGGKREHMWKTHKMVYVSLSLRTTSRKRRKLRMELFIEEEVAELEVCGPLFQKLVAFEAQRILSME